MEFKDRLRALRESRQLSAARLAGDFDKSEGAIRMWETGRTKPDADTLIKLASYFDCTTDYLLGLSDFKNEAHFEELSIESEMLAKAFGRMHALLFVDAERNRQDAKRGEQNHPPQFWTGILGEEYGEYCQAVNETVFDNGAEAKLKGGAANMITEFTHVAAVAVGAIECLLRNEKYEEA